MLKRSMAFFMALVMVLGMCGVPAYAQEDTEPASLEVAAPAAQPEIPAEDAEQKNTDDALTLELTETQSVDESGVAHYLTTAEGESFALTVSAKSNGELSFRWQLMNDDGEYTDIDEETEPTALTESLSLVTAEASLAEDAYRCVVTAVKGEETLTGYAVFTVVMPASEPADEPTAEPSDEPASQAQPADGVTDTGVTGELTWTLLDNGQLLISGVGAMPDYSAEADCPWAPYADSITRLTVESGVSAVSADAFADCASLTDIVFKHSASDALSIAAGAFPVSSQLATTVTVPGADEINAAVSAYSWADDNRSVTYLYLSDDGVSLMAALPTTKLTIKMGEDIVAETGKTVGTVDVDISDGAGAVSTTPLALTAVLEPENSEVPVKWKSSNVAVATVNADSGEVSYLTCGTTTITATAADGSGKYASVKLVCYYVNKATAFTAKAEDPVVPSVGLQCGDTTNMVVYGKDADNKPLALDPELFEFSIPELQRVIANVDGGLITAGAKPGTVTVNASLLGDPLKRKVTLKVRVIPLLTTKVQLTPPEAEGDEYTLDGPDENNSYVMTFDKAKLGTSSTVFKFVLTPQAFGMASSGTETEIIDPSLTYTSSNTGVATVAVDSKGVVTVSVKRTATALGECIITGTAKDNSKVSNKLTIRVLDYTPRIGSKTITYNPNLEAGVSVSLLSSYGNEISDVELLEYNASTKKYDTPTRLGAVYAEDKLTITQIPLEEGALLPNCTVKAMLKVTCAQGDPYNIPITVVVKYAAPAVTIKQTGKFNLFYSDSETLLTATAAADYTITHVELDTHPVFDGVCNSDETPNQLSVTYGVSPVYSAKPNVKLTALVYFEGYINPVQKAVTLVTTTVKPTLYTSASSAVINTLQLDKSVDFTIYDKSDKKEPMVLDSGAVTSTASFVSLENDSGHVTLSLVGSIGGTAKIDVQNGNWLLPVSFNFNAKAVDVAPKATLSTSVMKLNSVYYYNGAVPEDIPEAIVSKAVMKLNQSNTKFADVLPVMCTAAPGTTTASEAGKISFVFSAENGELKAYINDSSIKNGNYTFIVTPTLDSGLTLNSITLRVSVTATLPTASLTPATLKLNNVFTDNTDSTVLKLNRVFEVSEGSTYVDRYIGNVKITPLAKGSALAQANKLDVKYNADGTISAEILDEFKDENKPKAGTYSFSVTPLLEDGGDGLALKPIVLKVILTATVPKITLVTPSVRVNSAMAGDDIATSLVKSSLAGYTITEMNDIAPVGSATARAQAAKITVSYSAADNTVLASITSPADPPKAGTYSFTLTPTVENENGQSAALTPVRLSVTVYSNANVTVSVSASGKLDAILRDTSSITYTAVKLNNLNGKVEFAELVGVNADLFTADADINEKGQTIVVLKLKDDADYSTSMTYRIGLMFNVIKSDGTAASIGSVGCQSLSFKVVQSALKLKVAPASKTMYLGHPEALKYTLQLVSPKDASLETEVTVNSSTTAALRQALGETPSIVYDASVDLEDDPTATNLTVDMSTADMSKLVAGKSYTLVLNVKPVGCAANVNPTQIRTTIKVYK